MDIFCNRNSKVQIVFKYSMFESKISAGSRLSGFKFGDISSVANVPSANSMISSPVGNPGFIAILCPSHPTYAITNICKSQGCIEPLCPQCITKHIRLHEQSKRPAKIDTLVAARVSCIQRVAEQKFYAQGDLEKLEAMYNTSPEKLREDMESKLGAAKVKLTKLIDRMFDKMFQSVEAIYSASLYENQRSQAEFKRVASPTIEYLNTVNQYKTELESEDFIPALIQVLTSFPKRPEVRASGSTKIQTIGSVNIDEKSIQDVQKAIDKYVKVNFNVKEQRLMSFMNSNSNNTKFSRIGLERSRSNESRMLASQNLASSRVPIVAPSLQRTNSSRMIPVTVESLVMSPYRVIQQSLSRELNVKITQPDFFKAAGYMVWFEDGTKHYYRAEIDNQERGFQRFELNIKVPEYHRSIVIPTGQIYLLGGRIQSQTSNKVYVINGRQAEQQPSMITERASFACCFNSDSIYVAGGITSNSETVTTKFQKYDIYRKAWRALKACPDANYGGELVSLNHTVILVGAKLDLRVTGGISSTTNRLEVYNIANDSWSLLPIETPLWEVPSSPGLVQISENDLLVFGGIIGDRRLSDCTKLEFRQGTLRIQRCPQLYSESTFWNPSVIWRQQVVALQNSGRGSAKHMLRFSGQSWKFISC